MDRREAILRELNLYPLWVRRGEPAPEADAAPAPSDGTTSQSTKPASGQVAGYPLTGEGRGEGERRATDRPGESEADARQSATAVAEPVPGAAEGLVPSCANPPGREQRIAGLDWPELKTMVRDCTACKLRAGCTQTVFGVGDEQADWLFVGEGPGEEEDAQGEPFVGQAGKLLDNMLLAIGLRRGSNVYIANIVKCRPPGNRTPEADEIATCLPYLRRQIQLIQPRVIVALGKTAAVSLLGRDATLASLRGTLHDHHRIPLIVTYHPAYLLRTPSEKAKAWEDLRMAVRIFDAGE